MAKADDPHQLNLAYQELKELPKNVIQHYSKTTFVLDLSHNQISYPFVSNIMKCLTYSDWAELRN